MEKTKCPISWKWDKENYPEIKTDGSTFRGGYDDHGEFYEQRTDQDGSTTYYKP